MSRRAVYKQSTICHIVIMLDVRLSASISYMQAYYNNSSESLFRND